MWTESALTRRERGEARAGCLFAFGSRPRRSCSTDPYHQESLPITNLPTKLRSQTGQDKNVAAPSTLTSNPGRHHSYPKASEMSYKPLFGSSTLGLCKVASRSVSLSLKHQIRAFSSLQVALLIPIIDFRFIISMQRAREDQGFLLNRDSECRVTTANLEKGLAVSRQEIKRGGGRAWVMTQ